MSNYQYFICNKLDFTVNMLNGLMAVCQRLIGNHQTI